MYSYLRGVYKGKSEGNFEAVVVDVNGIGFEAIVPPIVEQALTAFQIDDPITLYVTTQSGRDQPWPTLFGFLTAQEKAFWELLVSVPRVGGKLAARAMVAPIEDIAEAISSGNRAFLDGLPGVTLDGADKIIAALRKKVAPFVTPTITKPTALPARRTEDQEMRDDAVALLIQMGLKRPEAQRGVDQLLATRDDVISIQDIITEFFRAQSRAKRSG